MTRSNRIIKIAFLTIFFYSEKILFVSYIVIVLSPDKNTVINWVLLCYYAERVKLLDNSGGIREYKRDYGILRSGYELHK